MTRWTFPFLLALAACGGDVVFEPLGDDESSTGSTASNGSGPGATSGAGVSSGAGAQGNAGSTSASAGGQGVGASGQGGAGTTGSGGAQAGGAPGMCDGGTEDTLELCTDTCDNDLNGFSDCDDFACARFCDDGG